MSNFGYFDQFVWAEKYRPRTLKDVILPARITKEFEGFLEKKQIPNLLMAGSAGIGKTTLGIVISMMLDYEWMVIDCSNEGRFLDTFRNKVANFCSAVSLEGKRKCIILDEMDNLPEDVQKLLRGFTERFSGGCSFIGTCNFENRIIEPLHSRFSHVEVTITAEEKKQVIMGVFKRTCEILEKENVTYDKKAVSLLVAKYFPDFRRLLNELQRYAATGNIDSGVFVSLSEEYTVLIDYLKAGRWNDMRKWVATQPGLELHVLCRALYIRADEFMKKESLPQFTVLAAEYQYKASFVADKEINTVAFLTQIISNCEFV